MKKRLTLLLMAFVTLSVFASQSPRRAGTVTDELTWEGLGLNATSPNYTNFQEKSFSSEASYAGNASSGTGKYIQLRSSNNNSGIVTTKSGGNIKSITIIWNSNTTAERTLSIYGKNEAYTDATDLYSDSKGDLLGELSYTTESKTLNVQGTYTHIGLRSKTGAQYIDKIIIEWESEAEGISIIHNGNLEGEDASSFKAKEYGVNQANGVDVNTILNATIVDGAGVNGSRGIVVQAAPLVSESWDTQFFIVFDEPLFEQTTLSIKFDYKASSEATVDVQAHYGPGEYNYYDIGCGLTFKEGWQTFEKTIIVEPSWTKANGEGDVRGFKTIAFNLTKENAMTYYFDNIEITAKIVKLAAPKWINVLLNGNCESDMETGYIGKMSNWDGNNISESELYSFWYSDLVNGKTISLVDGAGVNGSRCAVVESNDNATDAWETQFFITSPHQFKPGQRFYLKFDYRADNDVRVSTNQQGLPFGYIYWEGIGDINFTTEWQTFEKQFTVSENWCTVTDADGNTIADWNSGVFFQTISFNLNEDKNLANKFYFDNIEWSLDDGENGYASDEERQLAEIVQNQTQNGGATDTWTVAGEPAALFGTEWAPSLVINNMTLENGIYTWTKNNVELTGNVQFKVVKNHSWDNEAYPYSNYVLEIPRASLYDVLITFNPETKEITATASDKKTQASSIAELISLEDQTSFNFTGEALIVAKPTDNYVYIKDNSGSCLIYDKSGTKTAAAKVGKTIAANWSGKVNIYQGLFELVPDADIIVTDGNATAITYEEAELNDITEDNINKVVVLKNITYTLDGNKDMVIFKGGTNIKGYNKFDIDIDSPEDGATYNVIGAISYYKNQIEFQPLSVRKAAEQQYSVSFVNIKQWNKVCAYAWIWDVEENAPIVFTGDWPGTEIAKTGEKTVDGVVYDIYTLYLYTEDIPDFVIFNNGNWGDGNQTADLPFINGKEYDSLSPPIEVELGASGCATLSSEYMLSFAGITDVKAYRASEVVNNVAIMTPLENKVEANMGIFLVGEPNTKISIPTTFGGGDYGNNLLRPSVSQTVVAPSTEGSYRYMFKDIYGQEGFYLITGESEICPAGKAYLETAVPLSVDNSGLVRWMTEEDYLKYGTSGGSFKVLPEVSYQYGEEITSVEGIKMTFGQKLLANQEHTGQYADFKEGNGNNPIDGFIAYTDNGANPKDDNILGYLPEDGNLPTNGTFYTFEPENDGALITGIVLNKAKPFYILEDGVPVPEFRAVYISKEYGEKYYGIAALNVKGGKKYHMFATGSKLGFYGYTYLPGRTTDIIGPEGTRDLLFSSLSYTLPEEDILYDGESHAAAVEDGVGRGTLHILYKDDNGNESETAPVNPGIYTVSFDFEEGNVFNAIRFDNVGTFGIYQADEQELGLLANAQQSMSNGEGWGHSWDLSTGIVGAKNLFGITFTKGHITAINLADNNMSGTFPVSLLALPQLELLCLAGNQLTGNIGELTNSFLETHQEATIAIKRLDISYNQLEGNVGLFASKCPNLEYLDVTNNKFDEVSPAISSKVTSLFIGEQEINCVVDLHLKDMTAETLSKKLPSILLYNHRLQDYSAPIDITLSGDNDWSVYYHCQDGEMSMVDVSLQNVYKGGNGALLSTLIYNSDLVSSTIQTRLTFDEGDSNFDGKTDLLDLPSSVNFIFDEYKKKPFNFTAANLWKEDAIINVQDIISLVNQLFVNTPSSPNGIPRRSQGVSDGQAEAFVYCIDGKLIINSTKAVSAFDIMLSGGQSITITNELKLMGFVCESRPVAGGVRLIGYSMSGSTLPTGETIIGSTAASIVSHCMLADKDADEIPCEINNNESTSVNEELRMKNEECATAPIYNLAGQRVDKPAKGLYIVNGKKKFVNGNETTK